MPGVVVQGLLLCSPCCVFSQKPAFYSKSSIFPSCPGERTKPPGQTPGQSPQDKTPQTRTKPLIHFKLSFNAKQEKFILQTATLYEMRWSIPESLLDC